MEKEKHGQELIEEAKRLGIAFDDIFPSQERGASDVAYPRLQERVRNAKSAMYARRTWVIALASSVASVISAVAAWVAVLSKMN